jgi:hypothetical protein
MQKRISLMIVWGILMFGNVVSKAQNSTNSPYTRYGYGDLANRSFGAGRSMGGIGIGFRTSKQINPMNPASYSSIDSTTFLFDFGATFQTSFYNDGTNKQKNMNGNVEYMAMEFPLFKQMAMSAGLLPYSHVGYRFDETKTSTTGLVYRESSEGIGGLNLLYTGLSIELWKKRLSIGSNVNYLFGTISHIIRTAFGASSSTAITGTKVMQLNDVIYDFGLQYVHPLSKTDDLTFGLTFTPGKKLNYKTYEMIRNDTDVISDDTITSLTHDVPNGYGAGVMYVKSNKLIVAVDFTMQEWSKASFEGKTNQFNNRSKIVAGFELIPNLYSRPYINRMRYRAGLNYTNSYLKVNGNGYKEYGVTLGLGFPISDNRSYVNFSFEYAKIIPDFKTMINENYLRMTLSYTFNEYWFFKRKMD